MSKKPVTQKADAEKAVKDIRRATRKVHSTEEKIRIGEDRGAKGRAPRAPRSRGRSVIELYNTLRPHSSLGYRPPAPEAFVPMDQRATMH